MSGEEPGSVAFDRAAGYYDATRVVSRDATRRQTDLLVEAIGDRGRTLEIGVGTGQVSIPLHAAGVPIVGMDLSGPMLRRLIQKTGGAPPFPVVQGDATRTPFEDGAFGGVVLRWVLHLIPAWRDAVSEFVRVVRPGGVVLVNHGGFSGIGREIRHRMQELVGRRLPAVGLDWSRWTDLAEEMARAGAEHRELQRFVEHSEEPIEHTMTGIEEGRYSWLWGLEDEERRAAAGRLRPWLADRYGALDAPRPHDTEIVWHAYDLPEDDRVAPRAR